MRSFPWTILLFSVVVLGEEVTPIKPSLLLDLVGASLELDGPKALTTFLQDTRTNNPQIDPNRSFGFGVLRNLFILPQSAMISVVRHSPLRGSPPIQGQQNAVPDPNPFAKLVENAVEVVLDSIQTNAKVWAVPIQQVNSLVHDFFAGLADVTTALSV
eukprot:Blabericola_migrator_1__8138@NODE_41_length_17267_cov_152_291279_g37_i0_p8_GENE_NODE_41_length_17267_cov_152_291279_g37_i0NODE_41_length_17267_cov_152_291279_g37_i0_p8_ORF_typecomplete_len158_score17_18_NODE_41_length_17267_cov_152_291279_g37_i0975910232